MKNKWWYMLQRQQIEVQCKRTFLDLGCHNTVGTGALIQIQVSLAHFFHYSCANWPTPF